MKCLLTHDKCRAIEAGFYDDGDSCPIRKYKDSTRRTDGRMMIDSTCRYYGIARAKELQKAYREDI